MRDALELLAEFLEHRARQHVQFLVGSVEQEQTDRALAQIERSLQLDSRHAKTLLNQGIIRAFGKQDLKGAAESWEKVLAVAPGTQEAQHAQQGLDGIRSAHGAGAGAGGSGAGTAGGSGGR